MRTKTGPNGWSAWGEPISKLCRREGTAESLYNNWSKHFMDAGKKRLAGDTVSSDVQRSDRLEARSP